MKITIKQNTKKQLIMAAALLSVSALSTRVVAQIGGANIQGVIAAQLLPQRGVEVTAKNIDNGYVFRAITQKDGSYAFKGLNPGRYQVFLQNKSDVKLETITLTVGQTIALDFEIAKPLAEKIDEIVVLGSKIKSSGSGGEIGAAVSLEQINKLPQNTRNFLAFADLAPGVQFTTANDGSTQIKGGAQTSNAINVFIDGVGQKNYVLRGGVTGQDSSRGNPFPQSAIGEYKVITQNYSAEYDQLSSAAIVAVTKSGGNEFHGGMFIDYTNENMRKLRPSEIESGEKVPSVQKQFGINVGGPIIQDKMHFFIAYEGKDNIDPKEVIAGGGVRKDDLPAELGNEIGGRSADFNEDLFFGKLDYLISDRQKLELSAKLRRETELTNIGNTNAASYGTDKKNDETRIDLSHNFRADDWVNDAHLIYEENSWNPRPHTMGNGYKYLFGGNQSLINIGGGENFQDKGQSGWGLQEDFSYLAFLKHTVKVGFKYKSISLHAKEQLPYNPQFEYNVTYDPLVPYRVKWGAPLTGIGDGTAKAHNKQLGLYIQDDWKITERFTLNSGLRWDYEKSDSFLHYKTPMDVVSAIPAWIGIKKSDININDYLSNGSNREAFKNAWQPRVGFTYNISDESDTVIFGGVGRAYDRNLFDNLQLETTKATFPTYEVNFYSLDPSHTCTNAGCVKWDSQYLSRSGLQQLVTGNKGAGREIFMVNNKLKTPYSDQFSFGVRGSLNEYWKGEVSLSRIQSKDGFAWRLANRRYDGSFFEANSTWGAPFGPFGVPGFGATLIGDNGIETKENALYFKLDKPKAMSNWGLTFVYTYTDAQTNRESGEVFALDYPKLADYGMHDANKIPEHRLVVASTVSLAYGVDFSAKLHLQSKQTYYGTDCRAGWNRCRFNTFKPEAAGYKQLDIAFSKDVTTEFLSEGSKLNLRLDVLNLWNSINYDTYQTWFGGAGESLPDNFGEPNDEIAGPMRTVKLGISWNW